MRVFSVIAYLLLGGVATAQSELVDAEHDVVYTNTFAGFGGNASMAQTFTVGITGYLTAIELSVGDYPSVNTVPLIVDISRTSNGIPDPSLNGVMARQIVDAVDVPGPTPGAVHPGFNLKVDFSTARLRVREGDHLAIILRSGPLPGYFFWWKNILGSSDTYTGGSEFAILQEPVEIFHHPSYDLQFRTYVTVPEPCGALMAIAGALGIAATRRRNSTARNSSRLLLQPIALLPCKPK